MPSAPETPRPPASPRKMSSSSAKGAATPRSRKAKEVAADFFSALTRLSDELNEKPILGPCGPNERMVRRPVSARIPIMPIERPPHVDHLHSARPLRTYLLQAMAQHQENLAKQRAAGLLTERAERLDGRRLEPKNYAPVSVASISLDH